MKTCKGLLVLLLVLVFSSSLYGQTFMGNYCTDDCSGHEAGYEWAENNDIDDSDDCTGNSDSFNEGCESYVEEQEDEREAEEEDEEDEDEWD